LSRSRYKLEEMYRRLALEKLRRESGRREGDPVNTWLRQYEDDPNGFIREIVGPSWDTDTWLPWRAFISAVFAKEFASQEERDLYFACTKRISVPTQPFKEVWCPIGRRGGKSRVFALIAVWLATCKDWSRYLVAGEEGLIPILADARDRALQTMGYVKARLEHPRLQPLVMNDLAEEITLRNSVIIRVGTASIRAARSRTVLTALCDEIAFWQSDELGANPDKEIIRALRPAMLTIPESRLFCLSSPYARRGMLWDQYKKYYGKEDERVLVWQADTMTMHPTVDREEIDKRYEDDPAAAAAEFGAQFRSDLETIISTEVVDACMVRGRTELSPDRSIIYKAFVDPSGGSSDSMTMAVAHLDRNGIAVLDCIRERKPPFSPENVVEEFCGVIKSYGLVSCTGDRYGGEWPTERFALNGVSYEISEMTRSELYQAMIPLLNSRKAQLLDSRVLETQLTALERRPRAVVRDLIDHPPGAHDDVSNAVAGALVLVAYDGAEVWQKPWQLPNTSPGASALMHAQMASNRGRYMR
jgi:hypothetical protein